VPEAVRRRGFRAFVAEATDAINRRHYAAGKGKVAQAPLPVARHSSYSVKIAAVCTAITNLIK
jgi:hypothetical protein